jgi:hypothetical protein
MGTYSYTILNCSNVKCQNCGWYAQGVNVQGIGKIHAKKYGHKVCGELAHLFSYDYSSDCVDSTKKESK